jgi:hypothetical protein
MKKYRLITVFVFGMLLICSGVAIGEEKKGEVSSKTGKAGDAEKTSIPVSQQAVDPPRTLESQKGPASTAGEQINWQVLSGGGGPMSTTGYTIRGTLGQTAAGLTSTTGQSVNQGYWQNFGAAGCCDTPGDANDDGMCDIGDGVYLISYIFKEGPYPICMEEGDANVDCWVDVGDVVYIVSYIFREGAYPECGCWDYSAPPGNDFRTQSSKND